jgi:hypothetical protein
LNRFLSCFCHGLNGKKDVIMAQNVRRPVKVNVSESYDPKQRAIGGVVLTLIMLLIYFFLQALVTLSIPTGVVRSPDGGYVLDIIKDDEKTKEVIEDANGDVYIPELPSSMSQFVFLDIDGTPFGADNKESSDENLVSTPPILGTYWIVQAASFKEYSRAENFVTELENGGVNAEIKKIGSWYTVRTVPQRTEAEAENMKQELRKFGIKGLIKKIQ